MENLYKRRSRDIKLITSQIKGSNLSYSTFSRKNPSSKSLGSKFSLMSSRIIRSHNLFINWLEDSNFLLVYILEKVRPWCALKRQFRLYAIDERLIYFIYFSVYILMSFKLSIDTYRYVLRLEILDKQIDCLDCCRSKKSVFLKRILVLQLYVVSWKQSLLLNFNLLIFGY